MGDQDIGSPGRPVSSGLQVPGEPEHCRARTSTLGELTAAFFFQSIFQLQQQRLLIFRVDNLAFWKVTNEEDCCLDPKKSRREFSKGFLHSEFLGRGEPLCPHSIDCCFVSGS